jgi:XTP/dITP diphosphohydrolase
VEVVSLKEIGFLQEIDETGETLEENSALKAREVWEWLVQQDLSAGVDGVFADDTGLEIVALGGLPGVRTARWAGDDAVDVNNRQKALRELLGKADRSARFRTVVTLIMGGEMQQVEGIVNGRIAQQEEGEGGFGYDPVFIPEGYDKTFASLSAEIKNSISHRGRALEALKEVIQ